MSVSLVCRLGIHDYEKWSEPVYKIVEEWTGYARTMKDVHRECQVTRCSICNVIRWRRVKG